jgi:pimeloyl-ACP methyl ester carboxylesterase
MVQTDILTVDRLIDHVSTVPAIAGEAVQLFVREKARGSIAHAATGEVPAEKILLIVHGGYWPCVNGADLQYRDYSWMEALASAGYDVFAMDMTGYGFSSRPLMDDPANLPPDYQDALIPGTLSEHRTPTHPVKLVTSNSETDDIDRVVDFICKLRGVDKISLLGWSGGGIRTGTYVVRHQEKVEKLIIFASSNYDRANPDNPPATLPEPGYPMTFQTRAVGIDQRWGGTIKYEGQVEPGVQEIVWKQTVETDSVGASWGPGGLRAPTRTYWGWNAKSAATIKVPVLIMVGEYDRLLPSNIQLFEDIGTDRKVLIEVKGASHFMQWEIQRRILHSGSHEWLDSTSVAGVSTGRLVADMSGDIAPV